MTSLIQPIAIQPIKYELKVIGTPANEEPFGINRVFNPALSVRARDESKAPYTGQPDGTAQVYLFKHLISAMQHFIDQYGDGVGYTNHHCGMGHWEEEIVVVEPIGSNPDSQAQ